MKITLLIPTHVIFLCHDVFNISRPNWHGINLQISVKDFVSQYTHYVRYMGHKQHHFNVTYIWSKQEMHWISSFNAYPSGHLVPSPMVGLACAPIVETRFLELVMSLLDFSPRIPLGTFSILLLFILNFLHNFHRNWLLDKALIVSICIVYLILSVTLRHYWFNVWFPILDAYFKIHFWDRGQSWFTW